MLAQLIERLGNLDGWCTQRHVTAALCGEVRGGQAVARMQNVATSLTQTFCCLQIRDGWTGPPLAARGTPLSSTHENNCSAVLRKLRNATLAAGNLGTSDSCTDHKQCIGKRYKKLKKLNERQRHYMVFASPTSACVRVAYGLRLGNWAIKKRIQKCAMAHCVSCSAV